MKSFKIYEGGFYVAWKPYESDEDLSVDFYIT